MAENSHPPESTGNAVPTPSPQAAQRQLLEKLLKVPGVTHAVVSDKNGVPLYDQSDRGRSLAARGKVLFDGAILAGKAMGVGETKSVAAHDQHSRMLVYTSDNEYLHISVTKDVKLALVETAISKILATGR
jgi:predicted regulator of Ras-like GTPase activity (Roadblock/LC7/MglB family)